MSVVSAQFYLANYPWLLWMKLTSPRRACHSAEAALLAASTRCQFRRNPPATVTVIAIYEVLARAMNAKITSIVGSINML